MKRTIIATALAGILITCISCTTTPTADKSSTATSSYTAAFKVVSEPQTAVPGGASSLDLPKANSWGFNSYVFMEVAIPTFPASAVELDEQMEGEQIPVLTFAPNEGWTQIAETEADGMRNTVYFYSTPVDADQPFTPLFDEWTLTNFRVRNGICGIHTYSEIIEAANEARVARYSLQAVMDGTPETLWSMVK